MPLLLEDPRQFSTVYPESNILISQAKYDLAKQEDDSLILALIEDLLKEKQDALLNIAYNLAPSQEISTYIWQSLQKILNFPPLSQYIRFFAIPLIIVVGSNTNVQLTATLNQNKLMQLFLDKQIFTQNKALISNKLYDLASLSQIKLAEIFAFSREPDKFSVELIEQLNLANPPIESIAEQVHLRFLLGVSLNDQIQGPGLIEANYSQLGLELMQLLTTELELSSATILPIPFPPCSLTEATVIGEHRRKEIHLTMRLSKQVQTLRKQGKRPQIKLATQDNAIKIEVWVQDAKAASEIIYWPLQYADNFQEVCQLLADLFADMQLEVSYVGAIKKDE